jgi:hypothetical protein
LVLY